LLIKGRYEAPDRTKTRYAQTRRNLQQWEQYKISARDARVRNHETVGVHGHVAINQKVKVDAPRAPADIRTAIPTLPLLDGQQGIKQINRGEPGQEPGHRVDELGLGLRAKRGIPQGARPG
jgi:hypothetical protein